MATRIRSAFLAAGAAALLSAQAAYAAPVATRSLDPLVTLSALGTVQSRQAVCAAGAAAASAAAASAAMQAAPGCILPITGAAPPPVAETPPPPVVEPVAEGGFHIGTLGLLLGLAALAGIIALIISENNSDNGELTPVSPA